MNPEPVDYQTPDPNPAPRLSLTTKVALAFLAWAAWLAMLYGGWRLVQWLGDVVWGKWG